MKNSFIFLRKISWLLLCRLSEVPWPPSDWLQMPCLINFQAKSLAWLNTALFWACPANEGGGESSCLQPHALFGDAKLCRAFFRGSRFSSKIIFSFLFLMGRTGVLMPQMRPSAMDSSTEVSEPVFLFSFFFDFLMQLIPHLCMLLPDVGQSCPEPLHAPRALVSSSGSHDIQIARYLSADFLGIRLWLFVNLDVFPLLGLGSPQPLGPGLCSSECRATFMPCLQGVGTCGGVLVSLLCHLTASLTRL